MLAVWECPSGNRAQIGSCLGRTYSCGIPLTISRALLNGFEPQITRKPTILLRVMSYTRHQRPTCSTRLPTRHSNDMSLDRDLGTPKDRPLPGLVKIVCLLDPARMPSDVVHSIVGVRGFAE